MNRIETAHYTRISKCEARKRYAAGRDLFFCPVNLNPESPWGLLYGPVSTSEPFEKLVNAFEWYNCTCNETGHYTAFYVRREEVQPCF